MKSVRFFATKSFRKLSTHEKAAKLFSTPLYSMTLVPVLDHLQDQINQQDDLLLQNVTTLFPVLLCLNQATVL